MTASLALLIASVLWIAGLRVTRDIGVDRNLEYWWALSAFFFGGVGTLGSFTFLSLTSNQGTALRTAPLVLLGLALTVRTVSSRNALIPPAGLALIFFFGILFTGDGLLMPLASLAAYIPALIVPAEGYNLNSLRAGASTGILLFLVLLFSLCLLQPDALFGACRSAEKCSYWGVALGALSTGNALGMYMAAASAITFLATTTWYSFLISVLGSLILTDLTASRSGLAAWAIGLTVGVGYRLTQRMGSRVPVILTTLGVSVLAATLPFMSWSAAQFTFRPILWSHAIRLFEQRPLLGYGASYWVRDENRFQSGRGFALVLNYSTHNIVLELLISTGVLGTLAFVLALLLASTGRRNFTTSAYAIALVGVVVGLSVTEVTSAPGRIYLFPGIGIYLFLVASAVGSSRPTPANRSARWNHSAGFLLPGRKTARPQRRGGAFTDRVQPPPH